MHPRLESSKQWTAFPAEYLEMITKACDETLKAGLEQNGKFIAQGQIYPSEILVRIGFLPEGSIRQINAEVSVSYDVKKENAKDIMALAVDCAGTLLLYGAGRPLSELPPLWQPHDFEGREVFIQYNGVNTELERMADELLGETHANSLVKGDASQVIDSASGFTAEQIKASLGILGPDETDQKFNEGSTTH